MAADVEAVEKVPYLQLRYADEKIDLSERAVFDDRAPRRDKRTPENRAILESGTFSTDSLGGNKQIGAMTAEDIRLTLEKDAEILRALIRHENDLTNHRTTWLLVSQSILFGAAGFFARVHWLPPVVVGVVGVVLAISIGQSLENSFEARQYFKKKWREQLTAAGFAWEDFPPLDGGVPGVRVVRRLFPWFAISRTFMVAWAVLILFFIWTPIATQL